MLVLRFLKPSTCCLIAAALVSYPEATSADDKTPPNPFITNAAIEVLEGPYSFKYDSFVRENDDKTGFRVLRCILAEKPKPLWVDWKKAGVKGWTNEAGEIQNGIPSLTKEVDLVDSELWYGAKPKKTDSRYKEPKDRSSFADGNLLRSIAKMGLAPPPEEGMDVPKEKPIDVDIEIDSAAVLQNNMRYLYTISWRDRIARPGIKTTVSLKWPETEATKFFGDGEIRPTPDHLRLEKNAKGIHWAQRESKPSRHEVVVSFVNSQGAEIGTAKVVIYSPAPIK